MAALEGGVAALATSSGQAAQFVLRLSVGIENIKDIKNDIEQAFNAI